MIRRRILIIALVWVATVTGASTLTWAVISATGTQVGQSVPISSAVGSSYTSSATSTPTNSAQPTGSARPSEPTATKTNKTQPSTTKPTSRPTAKIISDTWSGSPGTVTASCTGSSISLVSAVPNVGYRVEWEREGSSQLKIEFESTKGEEDEAHLRVTCKDGAPVFRRS